MELEIPLIDMEHHKLIFDELDQIFAKQLEKLNQ